LAYRHAGSAEGVAGAQGFFALVDLEARTAVKIDDIPYDPDFYLFQYQGFAVDGTEVYVTQAPVGENGNIYVINTETGEVTKGAELVNAEGSHFIGTF
jgi:DNA-binding beta-propeller fold protein YncE